MPTNFRVTMTTLGALNAQLRREAVAATDLVRHLVYVLPSSAGRDDGDLIECLAALDMLAGSSGLEEMVAPVRRLGELVAEFVTRIDQSDPSWPATTEAIDACLDSIVAAAELN